MVANRRRDTLPERAIRSALHRQGLRFRVDYPPLPGVRCRPDIVFTRQRVAVFIDGCFWHACPQHGNLPKANRDWWQQKLSANVDRDRRNDAALSDADWQVVRIWEHEPVEDAVDRVLRLLRGGDGACSPRRQI